VQRLHVRVVVPPGVAVHARFKTGALGSFLCRGLVSDLSAAGLSASITDGHRGAMPDEGHEVAAELEVDGVEALVTGAVHRVGVRHLTLSFLLEQRDGCPNLSVLLPIACLLTRRVDPVTGPAGRSLESRLGHQHFRGDGPLGLRVRTRSPSWWELSFLDFLVRWSESPGRVAGGRESGLETGVETGVILRSSPPGSGFEPLPAGPAFIGHPLPWRSLLEATRLIASRSRAALPGYAAAFDLIEHTLG
jgi:hypothetical protein